MICKVCKSKLETLKTVNTMVSCYNCDSYQIFIYNDRYSEYIYIGTYTLNFNSFDNRIYIHFSNKLLHEEFTVELTFDLAKYWVNKFKLWSTFS